ncbi:LppX_LprAFG lipoprotein [Nocardioides agariphilus]|uniref:LppX_LprAFG lipoprotein n=1 Tax=Nocardioides agariphilus TaxID=433664 RepID=A0A930VTH7_9ACTN|nr:LppX_LprAFG lipoprotein [Nocardioides agariphilus]MBF4770540.1 LppX_LprAFG lipoprotein [Nocardioides agariphilus]
MRTIRPARTRLVAVVATAALGLSLAACGSDKPEATDDPTSASSTTPSTADATDATEEPSQIDDGGQVAVRQFADRLKAGIDNTEQAHLEFTMSGTGGEMKGAGDVDYTSNPPEMQMSLDMGAQSIGMVLVDGTMYIKSSQAGDKYLAFDLSDPTNPLGADFSKQLDPAASMKSFVTALSSVTSAGTEEVDGETLDRYELVIDTTKIADQSTASQLPADMKVTVWLDDKDRMARSVMDMGAITYDASMTDFDKALDLKAPPKGEITQQSAG